MVGAFFIDFTNALIITAFLELLPDQTDVPRRPDTGARLGAAHRIDEGREPAQARAGGRSRGARLRAALGEDEELGRRRAAPRLRLRALSDARRSSVSRRPRSCARSAIRRGRCARSCRTREYTGVTRESPLEKTLFACDEMAGFVTAASLVRPSKSVLDLEATSVIKRMKDKAFARAGAARGPDARRRGDGPAARGARHQRDWFHAVSRPTRSGCGERCSRFDPYTLLTAAP